MRRLLIPLLCALVALACGFGAARRSAVASGAAAAGPQPVTPVLSARRVPGLLESLAADAGLRAQLDAIVARSPAQTCVSVEAGHQLLYEHNPDLGLLPASNEKLLTATAALKELGPSTRLRTTVVARSGPDKSGTVSGNLYVVGGGDPLLSTADYRATFDDPMLSTSIESLADRIVAAGVHRVTGRVIGDDSRYDNVRSVPSWPASYGDTHESGPISALTVNDGWAVFPTKAAPAIQLAPVPDPPKHVADTLALLLAQRGVTVDGGTASGKAPGGTTEITHLDSLPVSQLVQELLTNSDNLTAEMLLKELGHTAGAGTTANGIVVLQHALDSLHVTRTGSTQTDGSGLDRGNRVTCRLLLQVLDLNGPTSTVGAALPDAGKTGTLKLRFLNTAAVDRLHAKTGTLDDTSALSGYVSTVPGAAITFAYVANGRIVSRTQLQVENDLGVDLVAYPQGLAVAALGPEAAR